jgi:hypothetical protein
MRGQRAPDAQNTFRRAQNGDAGGEQLVRTPRPEECDFAWPSQSGLSRKPNPSADTGMVAGEQTPSRPRNQATCTDTMSSFLRLARIRRAALEPLEGRDRLRIVRNGSGMAFDIRKLHLLSRPQRRGSAGHVWARECRPAWRRWCRLFPMQYRQDTLETFGV